MRFRINYNDVIKKANRISENARELSAQINALTTIEEQCRSAWQGEASSAFMAKVSAMKEELTRTRRQIENLASTIRNCAERIHREDMDLADKASTLSTGR